MNQRTKAEWTELVKEYRCSGKSLKDWCSEKEINYKTMCGNTHLVPSQSAKRSEQEWISLISKHRASGMSRESWCREHEINSSTMISAENRLKSKLDAAVQILPQSPHELKTATKNGPMQKRTVVEYRSSAEDTKDKREATIMGSDSRWIEVGMEDSQESKTPVPAEKDAPQKEHPNLSDSKIVIRCGKLTIETDASYPLENLENLIGKLALVC